MSEDIRKMIDKVKNFKQFVNETILYHGTIEKKLDKDDFFGIHLGTKQSAKDRIDMKYKGGKTYIHRFDVDIKNPFIVDRDFDWELAKHIIWNISDISIEEFKKELIEDDSFEGFLVKNNIVTMDELIENKGNSFKILSEKGYDSIIYINKYEDPGSKSIIILNPKIINEKN